MNPILISGAASDQSIYESRSAPHHDPGTRAQTNDGRVFYYTWNQNAAAAALTVAELQVTAAVDTAHHEMAIAAGGGNAGQNVMSSITLGASAVLANEYQFGYIAVTDNTGAGQYFKIKEHAAADASATDFSVTLFDNIATALDATSTVTLNLNPYGSPTSGPQQSNTTVVEIPVGVPCFTIADNEYGWLQTWGPCAVLADEAVAVGQAVTVGTGLDGAVEEDDTATTVSQEFIVGYSMTALVDTERQLVDLRIRA